MRFADILVTYTYSLEKEDITFHAGPYGSWLGNRGNRLERWKVGFVVASRLGDPLLLQEDVIGLLE